MDVRRLVANRLHQHEVDDLDDRAVLAALRELVEVDVVALGRGGFDVLFERRLFGGLVHGLLHHAGDLVDSACAAEPPCAVEVPP